MAQYINKDALAAEIKERIETYNKGYANCDDKRADALDILLHDLNNFEVKEVDLEKELDEWMKYGPHTNFPWCTIPDAIKITAEHFFELGLKAQKGE